MRTKFLASGARPFTAELSNPSPGRTGIPPRFTAPFQSAANLGLGSNEWPQVSERKPADAAAIRDWSLQSLLYKLLCRHSPKGFNPFCSGVVNQSSRLANRRLCARVGQHSGLFHRNHKPSKTNIQRWRQSGESTYPYRCIQLPHSHLLGALHGLDHLLLVLRNEPRLQ